MNKLLIVLLGMALAGTAGAKLPASSPEAQAKAEEAKQKTAWSDKVAVAYKQKKGSQPAAAAPAATPAAPAAASDAAAPAPTAAPVVAAAAPAPVIAPCADPGPYVAAAAAAKVGVADSLPVPEAGKPPAPAEAKK